MPAHPYPIREIARQSGLSEATIDRVLNHRPGVRASTVAKVEQALADLDRQRSQLRLIGRTFLLDVVMQAPERFSSGVQAALEAELPGLQPAVVRCRFDLRETAQPQEIARTLEAIRRRGSHGVLLKAPDAPEIAAAVGELANAGIPVVTLVTDLPLSRRLGYVGIDNRAAGATAAFLLDQWLGGTDADVLIALSRTAFRGEEEREIGFRSYLREQGSRRRVIEATDTDGLDAAVRSAAVDLLRAHPDVAAVYSIGGGNTALLDAFDAVGRSCRVFVGHDLDRDNLALLRARRISAVLHHDLRADARRACQLVLQAGGALSGFALAVPSQIQVITPYNVPADSTG